MSARSNLARASDLARLAYGVALLLDPQRVGRTMTGAPLDPRARAVARVLGVRHVVQALACLVHGSPDVRRAGRATDLLHAASMVGLAAVDGPRRRQALTDGTVAVAFALAGGSARG